MNFPPDPAETFPPLGVVAYLSRHGPVVAHSLRALDILRTYPDYESCMPTLYPAQLAIDWEFSPSSFPRDPITNPLLLTPEEIAAEWDPWKLAALVSGSAQDLAALAAAVGQAQRDVHDVDRVLEDTRRKLVRIAGGRRRAYSEVLQPLTPTQGGFGDGRAELVEEYKIDTEWDVYKLREVFTEAQADVGRLMGRLANLRTELREKRQVVKDFRHRWNI
ncbi:hypothetical protein CSOJ01_13482 [Colletotrichum sojae]|uniref:Uncharacterized protein n=1 Tax=Colletotrichum sojae TaxID=2175907 RepID=A0A8H6ISB0_9PEZI|nr:hypothetical protein CSOJ01_13482 [Colletotrichum sojae]